ncbi:RNA polymerase sigma factor [candidate division CSSED10-310 bacterium]|uniref:RNA polymerase sigma factor n=1 Tax=candidate division CSSED10-310 bacterium TaxID=2855610 RepID=A0ABV6YZN3_UNCC1
MSMSLEDLVVKAKEGNRQALEQLVLRIQDRVFGLAIRMLWHPADAEDATQEILIKVITKLSTFRHESSFRTWLYRIASRHLLTIKKQRAERREITFATCEEIIDESMLSSSMISPTAEQMLLLKELRTSCLQGMLLCLDRPLRIAYIFGEVEKKVMIPSTFYQRDLSLN